jgi:hypothetical protein
LTFDAQILDRGEAVFQTRRSIDRAKHQGTSIQGPTFMIIGAQKSGTTALYEYIHQHPLVLKGVRRESHAFDWRWDSQAQVIYLYLLVHLLVIPPFCHIHDIV